MRLAFEYTQSAGAGLSPQAIHLMDNGLRFVYLTVGGLVMMELGRLPKGGETVDLDRFHFQVLRADNRRIHLLEMTLHDGQETAPPTENV